MCACCSDCTRTRHPHPCVQVRTQFRKIFTCMGFEEMPTNNYVESSFWNFDALFQPQQHPARDAHDTFFLTSEWGGDWCVGWRNGEGAGMRRDAGKEGVGGCRKGGGGGGGRICI
jgi:phenylalanyl-tRNA synthetase alpha subunit